MKKTKKQETLNDVIKDINIQNELIKKQIESTKKDKKP